MNHNRDLANHHDGANRLPRYRGNVEGPNLDESTEYDESLWRMPPSADSPASLSEKSETYSEFDEMILQIPLVETQFSGETLVSSPVTSTASLGKRKERELSEPVSICPFKPQKSRETSFTMSDDSNPFIDTSTTRLNDLDEPVIIAHSPRLQAYFDSKDLPYGVQYEIARLVTRKCLRYDDIWIKDLDELRDANVTAAPKTPRVLLARQFDDEVLSEGDDSNVQSQFTKEIAAKSPWAELDKEEKMLRENPFAGLGFSEEHSEWYGGKIAFRGTLRNLEPKSTTHKYGIVLERAELAASSSFTRRFGSKHFLRVKVPKGIHNKNDKQLVQFFKRPFILSGFVFRAFFAKDNNVHLVKTNEVVDGSKISSLKTLPGTMSFLEFLRWYNPFEPNATQPMVKWASRFQLGLSNTAPGLRLQRADILEALDIKSESGSDMTDGAGHINKSGLRVLYDRFDWDTWPTAIQTRVARSKGLLVQHPDDTNESPRIWLRPSQVKIKDAVNQTWDPAFLIVDVVRSSHTRTPSRLSVETIINLAENGVPTATFKKLIQDGLEAIVNPLLQWEGPDAMRDLWNAVARVGGVMSARRARENAGLARVKGYSDRDADDINEDDEDEFPQFDDAFQQRSSAYWADQISGCPSGLEETIMYLLDSGFTPQNCAMLRDKLEIIVKGCVTRYVRTYRIDVPMSCTALLVPDTHSVLAPDEIYFKSSNRNLQTPDGLEIDIVLGDVLVTRHPCKLPTDVQKWKAVDKPALRHYTDVIVFSTKGPRRAADYLSGGDYDGDKGVLIWQPELVQPFRNAPLSFSTEPAGIDDCFSRESKTVSDFQVGTKSEPSAVITQGVQEYLLGAIRDTAKVGMYSNFHDNAIYTLGYRHRETIRLAYMFCKTLDGSKTGLRVLSERFREDVRLYDKRAPAWKENKEGMSGICCNERNLTRPQKLGIFIMDDIYKHAKEEEDRQLQKIEKLFSASWRHAVDEDLAEPWRHAGMIAQRWKNDAGSDRGNSDLAKIVEHVERMYTEHRSLLNPESKASPIKVSPKKRSPKKQKAPFTELPIEVRQDKLRALSKKFASMPLPSDLLMDQADIDRVKASYAYFHDTEQNKGKNGYTGFPWVVAMRELCAIKARASGPSKTVIGEFYEKFTMKRSSNH